MGDLRRKPGVFDATGRSSTNLAWPGYLKHYFSGSSVYLSLFKRGSLPKIFYIYFFSFYYSDYFAFLIFFLSLPVLNLISPLLTTLPFLQQALICNRGESYKIFAIFIKH